MASDKKDDSKKAQIDAVMRGLGIRSSWYQYSDNAGLVLDTTKVPNEIYRPLKTAFYLAHFSTEEIRGEIIMSSDKVDEFITKMNNHFFAIAAEEKKEHEQAQAQAIKEQKENEAKKKAAEERSKTEQQLKEKTHVEELKKHFGGELIEALSKLGIKPVQMRAGKGHLVIDFTSAAKQFVAIKAQLRGLEAKGYATTMNTLEIRDPEWFKQFIGVSSSEMKPGRSH